jgi:hypothetical protein
MLAAAQDRGGAWDALFRYAMQSSDLASGKTVAEVARPDVIVQITRHRLGANMFEVTAVTPGYPTDLLHAQVEKLGQLAGSGVRGVAVGQYTIGGDRKLTFTKATFATDGIIDRERGILHVTPIIQAFAGAPAPYTVSGMQIIFSGETAGPKTLKSYSSPGVRLQAKENASPPMVEYRIQLLSQNPADLIVPDESVPEQNAPKIASTVQRSGFDWGLWIPLLFAAAAASILVYFLIVRAAAKPRR